MNTDYENKDIYTPEEIDALRERLNVASISDRKIFVSELGTVTVTDSYGNTKEDSFDNFAKKVNASIESGKNLIRYDKETNSFYLIGKRSGDIDRNSEFTSSNSEAYMINVNKKTMEDYVFGNYTNATLGLHDLSVKSERKNEMISREQSIELARDDVIEKANNSPEELTPLEAGVYFDYLRGLNKENIKTAAKEAGKITAVAGTPVISGTIMTASMIAKVVGGAAAVGLASGIGISVVTGVLTAGAVVLGEELVSLVVAMVKEGYEPYQILTHCKEAFENIKEKIEDIKVNRTKAKYLKQIANADKSVSPEALVIEGQSTKPLELEDNIMGEINSLVDKAAFINPQDREVVLNEAQELLQTYMERSRNIINRDKSIIDPDADNLINLRIDVCKKLAKMEIKVNEIRERDKKHQALTDEGKLLNDKIVEIGNKDAIEEEKKEDIKEMLEDSPSYEVLDYDDDKKLA